MFLDALEVFWQDWVMSYDLERQILIADWIGQNRAVLAWTGRARDSTPSTLEQRRERHRSADGRDAGIEPCRSVVDLVVRAESWSLWLRRRHDGLPRAARRRSDATLLYQRMLDGPTARK